MSTPSSSSAQDSVQPNSANASAVTPKPLTTFQFASYGAPAMPLSMVTLPLAVYLTPVYADSDGFALSLGFVGLVLALSRVFDGITDPLIGFYSDRIRTRWGRRKPFILVGTPIFVIGVWLLWVPPIEFTEVSILGLTMSSGYPYLLGVLVMVYIGATIKDVPYSAWGAELAQGYNERTVIMSWKEAFTVCGSLIGAMTPAIIVFWGYTKPIDAVYFLAIGVAILMPILILNMLRSVPEYEVQETTSKRLSIRESFRYVWNNEPYKKLVIIFLFSTIGSAMTNSLSFFFVKHVLLAGDLYGFIWHPTSFRRLSLSRFGLNYRAELASTAQPWWRYSGMPFGLVLYRWLPLHRPSGLSHSNLYAYLASSRTVGSRAWMNALKVFPRVNLQFSSVLCA